MTEMLSDELSEKCAVFGVFGTTEEASRLTFYGLWALQHRGQESSGIASSDGERLFRHTGVGLVSSVYREEDLEQLPGAIAIGHNRYSTSGHSDMSHDQPVLKQGRSPFAFAHNGTIPSTDKLEAFLKKRGVGYSKLNDSEMMAEAIACYVEDGLTLEAAITAAWPLFTGAFSCVVMNNDKLIAFRDHCGIRPLSIAKLEEGYVVASETCAFDTIGAHFLRDVNPGEMVVIDAHGLRSSQLVPGSLKLDIFEVVYFARPDSILLGKSVDEMRQSFGRQLAEEYSLDADLVVPVPDSAIPAALGYSQASGITFEMALIKNRYINRTFIRPTAQLREQDLRMKLNPIPDLLRGKRVVLIDDSIVRGTTTRKIVRMVREAGAKEVHVLISSPPVRYPDFYGINISDQNELIATKHTTEEIRQQLQADSLGYLSYDGMLKATGVPTENFSTACFNGVYPIDIGKAAKNVRPVALV
jgi:amidophosphoribosyltransferase